ncbi:MAG: FAD-dependent oxidoreductase [Candidatus Nomurabacteria bacterium]|nr:FAD-dependent oxidoreductase [Candidatus Nomurabacteria bacterium]
MNQETYVVKNIIKESPGVISLHIALQDGNIPEYVPGQYITVFFPELNTNEGKAYSISSSPGEEFIIITVQAMGKFSNKLCKMSSGDEFFGSLPYGYFYTEESGTDIVCIAGGIGITPFRGLAHHNADRNIQIFHSAKKNNDLIFKLEFDTLQKINKNISINYFVTRENKTNDDVICRRIQIDDVLKNIKNPEKTEFFICGSIEFVRHFWTGLKESGIPEETIYTEAFFS